MMGSLSRFAKGRPKSKLLVVACALPIFSTLLASASAQLPGQPVSPRPILTCVVQHDDTHFSAVFGYSNNTAKDASILVGANNTFGAAPEDRGQPIFFRPGVH